MRRFFSVLFLLVIHVWTCGCASSNPQLSIENQDLPQLLELGSEVCDPPCWYGIIPGQTTLAEAEKILLGLDFFTSDGSVVFDETYSVITWYGGEGNNAYLNYQDGTIQIIHFYFKTGTSLGTILERLGEPDGYFLSEDDEAYVITLFYPLSGIVFKASQEFSKPMDKNMAVYFGYYVPQTEPENFLNQYIQLRKLDRPGFNLSGVDYYQWEGLGICPEGLSFPELCEP